MYDGSIIWVKCAECSPRIPFPLYPLGFTKFHYQEEGRRDESISSRHGSHWTNKEEEAEGGKLARGRQEGKPWVCTSLVVSLGFLTDSLLLWGLILVYTQMAPGIFLGQCVSALLYIYSVSILCDFMARAKCITRKINKIRSDPIHQNQAHLVLWVAEHRI